MEELKKAMNMLRSEDPEVFKQGEAYILDQIANNPDFYLILFEYYFVVTDYVFRKMTLIFIRIIIRRNFKSPDISPKLPSYYNFIVSALNETKDTANLRLLANIPCLLAEELYGKWDCLVDFLSLTDKASFCTLLAVEINQNRTISNKYKNALRDNLGEIISEGLKSSNEEVLSYIPYLFSIILPQTNANNELPEEYTDILEEILAIAQDSLQMDQNNFNRFWESLLNFNSGFMEPFTHLAYSFFSFENLSIYSNSILFQIIIDNIKYIDPKNITELINNYIQLQLQQDDVDEYNQIWKASNSFARIDEDQTYELYECSINELFNSSDPSEQNIGIKLLQGFFFTFSNKMPIVIGDLFDILFDLTENYFENCIKENIESLLYFFYYTSEYFKYNLNDSMRITDFLIKILKEEELIEYHLTVRSISKRISKSPEIFEKWFELFQFNQESEPLPISVQSFPVYYSILLNTYTKEVNISHDKYKEFINYLIELYKSLTEKVNELKEACEEREACEEEDDDEAEELAYNLYSDSLLQTTISTLLFLFYFYDPLDLKDYVQPLLNSIMEVFSNEDLIDTKNYNYFNYEQVASDFILVFQRFKDNAISFLVENEFIDVIKEEPKFEDLIYILIEKGLITNDDSNPSQCAGYVLDELDEYKKTKQYSSREDLRENLEQSVCSLIEPYSKFLYKLNEEYENKAIEAHQLHKTYFQLIILLMKYSLNIYDNFNKLTLSLLRIVKPKRVDYNRENEWYANDICATTVNYTQHLSKFFISKIEPHNYYKCFDGLKNLMKLFMIVNSESGHELFENFILPFFGDNQITVSSDVLSLFSEMIHRGYANEDEMKEIINVMNQVIENNNEPQYYDSYPALFVLMNDFVNIDLQSISSFCEYAIEKFNDESLSKDAKESCALFLLSLFNANNEDEFPFFINCLDLFPFAQKKLMQPFFEQIKLRIHQFQQSKDENEALLRAFGRYLGFQDLASFIFGLTEDQHNEITDMFKEMIASFLNENQDATPQGIIEDILADQSTSIQYICELLEK